MGVACNGIDAYLIGGATMYLIDEVEFAHVSL